MRYKIVETDNFDGDYPDEMFVNLPAAKKEEAERLAVKKVKVKVKDKLAISFSGGETSAMMTSMILAAVPEKYKKVVVTFANTGQEHINTLQFVDACDKYFGFNTVWLEADVRHGYRKGTRHKIVTYETASRLGEPFEAVIAKYGISNKAASNCTRELKIQTMTSYLRSIGWKKGTYDTAIGIRVDEMHRLDKNSFAHHLVYPLIEWHKVSIKEVREFWERQPIRLNLHEHMGNCMWCWKKSLRKLLTIAKDNPEVFNFPMRMEEQYATAGTFTETRAPNQKRVFFRSGMSAKDILAKSREPFDPFVDGYRVSIDNYDEELDSAGACSESCEVY